MYVCMYVCVYIYTYIYMYDSVVKNLSANAGDTGDEGWIPGSGRSLGGGNGNSL